MKRRLPIVIAIVVLVSLAVGGCATAVNRARGAVATRVMDKIQGGSSTSPTSEQAAEGSSEEAEPTPKPPANDNANPPLEGGTESGGCFDGFPRYPGVRENEEAQSMARILMAGGFSESRGYGSSDPADAVVAFYLEEPAKLGWEPAPIQGAAEDGATLWWGTTESVVHMIISPSEDGDTLIVKVCQAAEK